MIVGIEGQVVRKEIGFVHIKLGNGLVYKVFVSLFSFSKIIQETLFLHVTHIIREDQESLYGFWDEREKKVFDTLIKLSGIGPSTALAVCSTLTPDEFAQALITQNIDAFKSVSGIGPKGAKRILVELGEFSLQLQNDTPSQGPHLEASMALETLGFKKEAIKKALSLCQANDTSTLIKEALQKLR